MTDFSLVPVDHHPDFDDLSLVPVDHDPFSADDMIQQARTQLESQPQRLKPGAGLPGVGVPANNPLAAPFDASKNPGSVSGGVLGKAAAYDPSVTSMLSPDKSTVDWSRYHQPFGELKAATYTPTQKIGNFAADALMGIGVQPHIANDLTSRLGNVLGLSPFGIAGSALDLIDAKRRDDLPRAVVAATGIIPGAKGVARGIAEEAGAALRRAAPKDVAFATHEAIPGADTGHLPGSINASPEARAAYSADPRSTWAFAPGGRDAIYAGGGGKGVQTQPTIEMQGLYLRPNGIVETNPGWTALPRVSSDSVKATTVLPADRNILNASEAVRGYVDAQNASAWHKLWREPGNSLFVPMPRKATPEQLLALKRRGESAGLPDVVDSGMGATMTRFYPPPDNIGPVLRESKLATDIGSVAGVKPQRRTVDHGFIDYVPAWQQGEGSGAATREMLSHLNVAPELRAAMNDNADIPQAALARLERDQEYSRQ
ncbi:MAG: hypothetical protein ABIL01_20655 [Pseudomonadota bacterium]